MEVTNRSNYARYICLTTFLLIIGLVILSFFRLNNIGIQIGLFVFFELIFLSKQFTYKIAMDDSSLYILYYRWGIRNRMNINIKNVKVEIGSIIANRGYKYKVLKIYCENELKYKLDTSDGFSEGDFETIENNLNKHSLYGSI